MTAEWAVAELQFACLGDRCRVRLPINTVLDEPAIWLNLRFIHQNVDITQ